MLENFKDNIREKVREFLQITEPSTATRMLIEQDMTHDVNVALHKILYRTDAYETEQAFKSLGADMSRFWASVPSSQRKIRKIRNDLYKLVINLFADLATTALNEPDFKDDSISELYKNIFCEDNETDIWELTKEAVQKALTTGDGAFKISIDSELSEYPIVEFYDAEFVDFKYKRGRLQEVIFYTRFCENKKHYVLEEHYGKGYIKYNLFKGDKEVDMSTTEFTSQLQDIEFAGDYIMAQPLKFWNSSKYENRGEPLLDGKIDEIDALDEVISQWMDALRAGRVNKYIPQNMIPRDDKGRLMRPNPFDNNFIALQGNATGESKIETIQPDIAYEAFETSYVNALQRCLMGICSPSSLGIDSNKFDDNATAQRERREITAWKRQQITDRLESVIPALINKVIKTYSNMTGSVVDDAEISVTFDEYNSPGIEEKIEIATKGAPGAQVLTYKKIAEIVIDDATEDEQAEYAAELEKLNNTTIEEPTIFPSDIDKVNFEEETEKAQETTPET